MKRKHYNFLIIILVLMISICFLACTKARIESSINYDISTTIYYMPESEYNLLLQNPSMERITEKSKYQFSYSYDAKTAERDFEFDTNLIFDSLDKKDCSEYSHLLYREIYGIPQAMLEINAPDETIKLQAAFFTERYPLALWININGEDTLLLIKAVAFIETPIEETKYKFEWVG